MPMRIIISFGLPEQYAPGAYALIDTDALVIKKVGKLVTWFIATALTPVLKPQRKI